MDALAVLIALAEGLFVLGCIGGIIYFIFQRRKEKKEEAKKNYKDY